MATIASEVKCTRVKYPNLKAVGPERSSQVDFVMIMLPVDKVIRTFLVVEDYDVLVWVLVT